MHAPDDLHDAICPICTGTVGTEQGYYDKQPHRRCRACGYEVKQRNPIVALILAVGVVLMLSVIAFYAGQEAVSGPTTSFKINSIYSPSGPSSYTR